MRQLSVFVVLLCTFSACALLEAEEEKGVTAHVSGGNLFITNKTEARVYYFVVGRETAALILWAPHLRPESSIAQDATAKIPYEQIMRGENEHEVIVYWWHAVWADEEHKPGAMQSFIVQL